MKRWQLDVQEDENGDPMIQLPDEFIKESGWKEGDRIQWVDRGDGSWEMKKIETELVLVECINQFRHRYVVEVPVGKSEWALDTVTTEEAREFSQMHLGETIVTHRVISSEEVLNLCNEDNSYCSDWSNEKKYDVFVTKWKDNDAT